MDSDYLKTCFASVCFYKGEIVPHNIACFQAAMPGLIGNLERMENDLPGIYLEAELSGNAQIAKGESPTLRITGHDSDTQSRRFKLRSTMNFDTNICSIDSMGTNKNLRGNSIGTALLGTFMLFAAQAGFSKYTVDAADTTGGYFWAKMGFLPIEADREDLEAKIRERYQYLKPLLDPFTQQKIEKILDQREVEKLWDLADEKSGKDIMSRISHYDLSLSDDFDYDITYALRGVLDEVRNISIGKLLLCGLNYSCEMNLRDTKQLNRLGEMLDIKAHNFQPAAELRPYR